jgi:hypothetical protein
VKVALDAWHVQLLLSAIEVEMGLPWPVFRSLYKRRFASLKKRKCATGMLGRITTIAGALTMICSVAFNATAQQNDFRVETDISIPEEPKPIQQTLTLFKSGVAYDFPRNTPESVTLIDPARQRIVLFDKKRQVQLQINMSEFNTYMDSAAAEASASPKLAPALLDAKLVSFDPNSKTVSVGEKMLRYEATLQEPPSDTTIAADYSQFANISARLNAWEESSPAPFARMALNAEIASKNALPDEITRTAFVLRGSKKIEQVIKCRLHVNWRLSKDDETQISEIGKMLVSFKPVSVAEFYQKPELAELKR